MKKQEIIEYLENHATHDDGGRRDLPAWKGTGT